MVKPPPEDRLSPAEEQRIEQGARQSVQDQAKSRGDGWTGGLSRFGVNIPAIGAGREADGRDPLNKALATAKVYPSQYGAGSGSQESFGAGFGSMSRPEAPPSASASLADWIRRPIESLGRGKSQPAEIAGLSSGRALSGSGSGARFLDLLRAGELKLRQGDLGNALKDADEATSLDVNSPLGHLLRSQILNRMGRFEKAELAARQSIEKGGGYEAYEALAWALLHQGRYDEAVEAASMAVMLNPNSATAFAIRAFAYERKGDRARMLADLERAAQLDPARFGKLLARAKAGATVFDPSSKDSWQLLEAVSRRSGAARRRNLLLGISLWLLAALLGSAYLMRKELVRWIKGPEAAAFTSWAQDAGKGVVLGGKYELRRPLSRDGATTVWKARDKALNRAAVVLKLFGAAASQETRLQWQEQARLLASLHHPNIVEFYEAIDMDSGFYLVFEFVVGKTLKRFIEELGPLSLKQALQLIRPACEALDFCHSKGLTHGELRPSSIMLAQSGHVKVLDFGAPKGTPADDVRALAACLYEALTGKKEYAPVSGELAPGLEELMRRTLDRDAGDRVETAREFLALLKGVR